MISLKVISQATDDERWNFWHINSNPPGGERSKSANKNPRNNLSCVVVAVAVVDSRNGWNNCSVATKEDEKRWKDFFFLLPSGVGSKLIGGGGLLVVEDGTVRWRLRLLRLHLGSVVANFILHLLSLLLRHPSEFHRCRTPKEQKMESIINHSIMPMANGPRRWGREVFSMAWRHKDLENDRQLFIEIFRK